jgi:hypothetical protein
VGPFAEVMRREHLAGLDTGITQAAAIGIANLERWQRIAVGGVEEFIDVDRAIDPIILEVDFTRPDGRRVTSIELRGIVGPVSQQLDKSIKLIARDAKTADFLDGLFAAIVLVAAGEKMPAAFSAVVVGGKTDQGAIAKYTRSIRLPALAEARAYLAQLASDLLCSGNDYFLPIEAVEKLSRLKDLSDAALDIAVSAIRDKRPPNCRSDFGPIRNAREFRTPLEEIKLGLIARRYGPLRGMFAGGKKGGKRAGN